MAGIQLSPYINFQGRAREAMELYQVALSGAHDLQTVDERGVSRPAGPGERIAHARLDADGAVIVGSDGHPDYPAPVGENMAVALSGTDKDYLTRAFQRLVEGGRIKGPLIEQPWGGAVGWLTDTFGVNRMVTIHPATPHA